MIEQVRERHGHGPDNLMPHTHFVTPGEEHTHKPEPKRYRTIVVDPPWPFSDTLRHYLYRADREGRGRGAVANYKLMSIADIAALPVGGWAAKGAHIYVWTTNAFMRDTYTLLDAWGFVAKTILTWVKPRLGMGHYFRNTTEHVVFGVRGSQPTLRKDCRTAFTAEQGRHSEKPAAFYDMVESMSPGPYLDVFARRHRFNWDVYGNEVYSDIPLVGEAAVLRQAAREQEQG